MVSDEKPGLKGFAGCMSESDHCPSELGTNWCLRSLILIQDQPID